jgi:hypothetical protein
LASVGNVNGKPAYSQTATVMGIAGVTVSVYWLDAPDNVWVLDFDGQPYFQSACLTADPPATGGASCPWTAVTAQVCTGGSALSINGSGVLSIKLTSFTATQNNNEVVLNWQTTGEINNQKFDVQRSTDGSNWITIGSVNGAGNSASSVSYHFSDNTSLPGRNFYRLIQYDFDNKMTFSRIIKIDLSTSSLYKITGNPGNGVYQVNIQTSKPVTLSLSDLSGKQLHKTTAAPGIHRIDISRFPSGMYLLRINTGTEIFTEKLIKNIR